MKNRIALLLSVVMIWGMALQASAAGEVGSLVNCFTGISVRPNGIVLSVDATTTTDADVIGCRDIVLHETYNGVTKDIPITGGSTSGHDFAGTLTYTEAVKGASYSVSCTYFAKWGSTEKTLSGSAGPIVYN